MLAQVSEGDRQCPKRCQLFELFGQCSKQCKGPEHHEGDLHICEGPCFAYDPDGTQAPREWDLSDTPMLVNKKPDPPSSSIAMQLPEDTWTSTGQCLDILTLEQMLSTCTSANEAWRDELRERQAATHQWLKEYREIVSEKLGRRSFARTLSEQILAADPDYANDDGEEDQDLDELFDGAVILKKPALHQEWVAAGFPEPQVVAGQWPPLGPPIMPGHVSVSTRPHDYSLYGTPRFLAFFERGFDDDGG